MPIHLGGTHRAALPPPLRELLRRISVLMYLGGAVVSMFGAMTSRASPGSVAGQYVIVGLFALAGCAFAIVQRPSDLAFKVSIYSSLSALSAVTALSDPLEMAPFFFVWPVILAAYFFGLRMAVGSYAWMVLTIAIGLACNPTDDMKIHTFIGTVTTVGMIGWVVFIMTNQQLALRQELALAANTDPLTGLLNRRAFNPQLAGLVTEAQADGEPLALVMFDLDHFKSVNDAHGHLVGDQALQAVAALLTSHSRQEDLVSRFGGEEFAVALPGSNAEEAVAYTHRVAQALALAPVVDGVTLATSAGVAVLGEGEDIGDLLHHADDALYEAKSAGRGRPAVWGTKILVGQRFAPSE